MKETQFINQNKEKWERFEKLNDSTNSNPEELSNLYVDITDDLGYAQTHYLRRTVRVYLNQLAQKVFVGVNRFKKDKLKNLIRDSAITMPLEIYRSRRTMLTALIAFLVYVAIGVISTYINVDFPRIVMGDFYVDTTIQNIEAGNPLGIYDSTDQLSMFIEITTNNLKVSFLTFFVGFFFTVGTHLLLFSNGVMLGAFQYYFYTKGLFITSFLGIWIHGSFEISAIVLAGGAGITAGNGLLFPGTYTRFQSMKSSMRRGLKIMLMLVPFIIAAGFLESFVTHNYDTLPDWSKWAIIAFSFALMIFCFVVFPFYIAKRHPEKLNKTEDSTLSREYTPIITEVKKLSDIIRETILYYQHYFSKFISPLFVFIFPIACGLIFYRDYIRPEDQMMNYWYDWAGQLEFIFGYGFNFYWDFISFFSWLLLFALINAFVLHSFTIATHTKISFFAFLKSKFFAIVVGSSLVAVPIFLLPWNFLLVYIAILPFFQFAIPAAVFGEGKVFSKIFKSIKLASSSYFPSLVTFLLFGLAVAIFVQPIALVFSVVYSNIYTEPPVPDLLDMLSDFVAKISDTYGSNGVFWSNIVRQIVYLATVLVVLPIYSILSTFLYFSTIEQKEARFLKEQFTKFGKRDRFKETKDFED